MMQNVRLNFGNTMPMCKFENLNSNVLYKFQRDHSIDMQLYVVRASHSSIDIITSLETLSMMNMIRSMTVLAMTGAATAGVV